MIIVALMGVALATPVQRVVPPDRQLGVPLGEKWLPRDSFVKSAQMVCQPGWSGVEVTSVDPWYRIKNKSISRTGDRGCVADTVLRSPSIPVGDPQSESMLRAAFEERFGRLDAVAVKSTPWGRIAMPMTHELSAAERGEEIRREGLMTAKQQERAVVAEGPRKDGAPIYVHFLGSDAPRSDRWGTPSTVLQLLALIDAWSTHCREELPSAIAEANPGTCLVQLGDLGWYNDALPDPLGHRAHYRGTCVDIRLFRTVPSRYEAWWNRADDRPHAKGGYSQPLTLAFLQFATETARVTDVHFNDPTVLDAVPAVTSARGHDDHIHMCFQDG